MPSMYALSLRPAVIAMLSLGALMASPAPVRAQGFGVGARMAWVNPDTQIDVDALRYFGGQIRLIGGRIGFELSMDRHSESFEVLGQKVTETPLQASILLRMGSKVAPYLLGGPGWYRRKVEVLEGPSEFDISTTEFGWHGGIGLEILPNRHFGIHGDYRYTFLDFGNDDDDETSIPGIPGIGGILPGHRGSMWTLGATFYF